MSRTVRILSIDGGGIRGVIPAVILEKIEAMTGQPIATLFDLVAGTSIGGILAAALTARAADGRTPAFSASQTIELFETGGQIFPTDVG